MRFLAELFVQTPAQFASDFAPAVSHLHSQAFVKAPIPTETQLIVMGDVFGR